MAAPVNFSWVIDGVLGGMGYPKTKVDLEYLVNQGVNYLVSLTENPPKALPELKVVSIPIADVSPPTLEQVQQFLDVAAKGKKEKKGVVVHCCMGQGRTGTMLACYLVQDLALTAQKAIKTVRHLRPGSVETKEQEDLVAQFEKKYGQSLASAEYTEVDSYGKLPKEFTWVVNGRVGGMAFPDDEDYFRFLANQNVGNVVSLTKEPAKSNNKDVEIVSIPMEDFTPPTLKQIYQFMDAVDKATFEQKGLVVHCLCGHGRTGTMLACYLVKHFSMCATKAIEEIRGLRPGSIETKEQEQVIAEFDRACNDSAGPFKAGVEGKIPKEFTWIVKGKLGGMAFPEDEAFFQFLVNQGVKYVVSLTDEPAKTKIKGIEVVSIPMVNFAPPSQDQVKEFIHLCEKAQDQHAGVVVHCLGGHGHTGTMLACYLARFLGLSGDEAIEEIRRMRPGSVETDEQEEIIKIYAASVAKESAKLPKEFSWIQPGLLGGMALPDKEEYFQFLLSQNVKYVVSLTEEPAKTDTDIEVVSIPIADFTPPKLEQVFQCLDVVAKAQYEKKGVVVHCLSGHGRTGTMLACFMVKHMGLPAKKAIHTLKRMRPGSVETKEQEDLIAQFQRTCTRPQQRDKLTSQTPIETTKGTHKTKSSGRTVHVQEQAPVPQSGRTIDVQDQAPIPLAKTPVDVQEQAPVPQSERPAKVQEQASVSQSEPPVDVQEQAPVVQSEPPVNDNNSKRKRTSNKMTHETVFTSHGDMFKTGIDDTVGEKSKKLKLEEPFEASETHPTCMFPMMQSTIITSDSDTNKTKHSVDKEFDAIDVQGSECKESIDNSYSTTESDVFYQNVDVVKYAVLKDSHDKEAEDENEIIKDSGSQLKRENQLKITQGEQTSKDFTYMHNDTADSVMNKNASAVKPPVHLNTHNAVRLKYPELPVPKTQPERLKYNDTDKQITPVHAIHYIKSEPSANIKTCLIITPPSSRDACKRFSHSVTMPTYRSVESNNSTTVIAYKGRSVSSESDTEDKYDDISATWSVNGTGIRIPNPGETSPTSPTKHSEVSLLKSRVHSIKQNVDFTETPVITHCSLMNMDVSPRRVDYKRVTGYKLRVTSSANEEKRNVRHEERVDQGEPLEDKYSKPKEKTLTPNLSSSFKKDQHNDVSLNASIVEPNSTEDKTMDKLVSRNMSLNLALAASDHGTTDDTTTTSSNSSPSPVIIDHNPFANIDDLPGTDPNPSVTETPKVNEKYRSPGNEDLDNDDVMPSANEDKSNVRQKERVVQGEPLEDEYSKPKEKNLTPNLSSSIKKDQRNDVSLNASTMEPNETEEKTMDTLVSRNISLSLDLAALDHGTPDDPTTTSSNPFANVDDFRGTDPNPSVIESPNVNEKNKSPGNEDLDNDDVMSSAYKVKRNVRPKECVVQGEPLEDKYSKPNENTLTPNFSSSIKKDQLSDVSSITSIVEPNSTEEKTMDTLVSRNMSLNLALAALDHGTPDDTTTNSGNSSSSRVMIDHNPFANVDDLPGTDPNPSVTETPNVYEKYRSPGNEDLDNDDVMSSAYEVKRNVRPKERVVQGEPLEDKYSKPKEKTLTPNLSSSIKKDQRNDVSLNASIVEPNSTEEKTMDKLVSRNISLNLALAALDHGTPDDTTTTSSNPFANVDDLRGTDPNPSVIECPNVNEKDKSPGNADLDNDDVMSSAYEVKRNVRPKERVVQGEPLEDKYSKPNENTLTPNFSSSIKKDQLSDVSLNTSIVEPNSTEEKTMDALVSHNISLNIDLTASHHGTPDDTTTTSGNPFANVDDLRGTDPNPSVIESPNVNEKNKSPGNEDLDNDDVMSSAYKVKRNVRPKERVVQGELLEDKYSKPNENTLTPNFSSSIKKDQLSDVSLNTSIVEPNSTEEKTMDTLVSRNMSLNLDLAALDHGTPDDTTTNSGNSSSSRVMIDHNPFANVDDLPETDSNPSVTETPNVYEKYRSPGNEDLDNDDVMSSAYEVKRNVRPKERVVQGEPLEDKYSKPKEKTLTPNLSSSIKKDQRNDVSLNASIVEPNSTEEKTMDTLVSRNISLNLALAASDHGTTDDTTTTSSNSSPSPVIIDHNPFANVDDMPGTDPNPSVTETPKVNEKYRSPGNEDLDNDDVMSSANEDKSNVRQKERVVQGEPLEDEYSKPKEKTLTPNLSSSIKKDQRNDVSLNASTMETNETEEKTMDTLVSRNISLSLDLAALDHGTPDDTTTTSSNPFANVDDLRGTDPNPSVIECPNVNEKDKSPGNADLDNDDVMSSAYEVKRNVRPKERVVQGEPLEDKYSKPNENTLTPNFSSSIKKDQLSDVSLNTSIVEPNSTEEKTMDTLVSRNMSLNIDLTASHHGTPDDTTTTSGNPFANVDDLRGTDPNPSVIESPNVNEKDKSPGNEDLDNDDVMSSAYKVKRNVRPKERVVQGELLEDKYSKPNENTLTPNLSSSIKKDQLSDVSLITSIVEPNSTEEKTMDTLVSRNMSLNLDFAALDHGTTDDTTTNSGNSSSSRVIIDHNPFANVDDLPETDPNPSVTETPNVYEKYRSPGNEDLDNDDGMSSAYEVERNVRPKERVVQGEPLEDKYFKPKEKTLTSNLSSGIKKDQRNDVSLNASIVEPNSTEEKTMDTLVSRNISLNLALAASDHGTTDDTTTTSVNSSLSLVIKDHNPFANVDDFPGTDPNPSVTETPNVYEKYRSPGNEDLDNDDVMSSANEVKRDVRQKERVDQGEPLKDKYSKPKAKTLTPNTSIKKDQRNDVSLNTSIVEPNSTEEKTMDALVSRNISLNLDLAALDHGTTDDTATTSSNSSPSPVIIDHNPFVNVDDLRGADPNSSVVETPNADEKNWSPGNEEPDNDNKSGAVFSNPVKNIFMTAVEKIKDATSTNISDSSKELQKTKSMDNQDANPIVSDEALSHDIKVSATKTPEASHLRYVEGNDIDLPQEERHPVITAFYNVSQMLKGIVPLHSQSSAEGEQSTDAPTEGYDDIQCASPTHKLQTLLRSSSPFTVINQDPDNSKLSIETTTVDLQDRTIPPRKSSGILLAGYVQAVSLKRQNEAPDEPSLTATVIDEESVTILDSAHRKVNPDALLDRTEPPRMGKTSSTSGKSGDMQQSTFVSTEETEETTVKIAGLDRGTLHEAHAEKSKHYAVKSDVSGLITSRSTYSANTRKSSGVLLAGYVAPDLLKRRNVYGDVVFEERDTYAQPTFKKQTMPVVEPQGIKPDQDLGVHSKQTRDFLQQPTLGSNVSAVKYGLPLPVKETLDDQLEDTTGLIESTSGEIRVQDDSEKVTPSLSANYKDETLMTPAQKLKKFLTSSSSYNESSTKGSTDTSSRRVGDKNVNKQTNPTSMEAVQRRRSSGILLAGYVGPEVLKSRESTFSNELIPEANTAAFRDMEPSDNEKASASQKGKNSLTQRR